jgi:hypothetical protein
MPQYADGSNDWDTVDAGHFGVCIGPVTAGSSTWTSSLTCPTSDGTFWNAVPTSATNVAAANPLEANASAPFTFGLRIAPTQAPGAYRAPITFTVIAP